MSSSSELRDIRKSRQRYKTRKVSPGKLRLSIHRTNKHMYAQIIDDVKSVTLVSASTLCKDAESITNGGNKKASEFVGKLIAKRAIEKGIEEVVFDRSGFLYHGRVKTLADSAREAGLKF
jgi:large subunit ribosomal protein L18